MTDTTDEPERPSDADDASGRAVADATDPIDAIGTADAHGWRVTVAESERGGARFELRTG